MPNAHAHNDYAHNRPLLDALHFGFTSVEVDVHLIDGVLYVAHDRPSKADPDKSLQRLYLDPLKNIIQQNGGVVYPDYDVVFYLMIDIKGDPNLIYSALSKELEPIQEYLTIYEGNQTKPGPICLVLSGNRPREKILRASERIMALDGRPRDIGKGIEASYMPIISDNYKHHFKWKGEGPIPSAEWRKLRILVANAHAEGKKVRFWASPENPKVWKTLLAAQVDFINTDDLSGLQKFLKKL